MCLTGYGIIFVVGVRTRVVVNNYSNRSSLCTPII